MDGTDGIHGIMAWKLWENGVNHINRSDESKGFTDRFKGAVWTRRFWCDTMHWNGKKTNRWNHSWEFLQLSQSAVVKNVCRLCKFFLIFLRDLVGWVGNAVNDSNQWYQGWNQN